MKTIRFALKQTVPIFFTYVFIGIAFGIMMTEGGYSPIWTILSALFMYAGSMQIVMVSLLKAGVTLPMVAVMTLFVNARHIFYGLGFIERFRKMGWRMPYMVMALTDETYSILCSVEYDDGIDPMKADFLMAALNHSYWIFGCILGSLAGNFLPFSMAGIDFSATAFFLVVVVNQWKQYSTKIPIMVGLFSALSFYLLLGPERFLIPALCVSMVVLVLLRDITQRRLGVTEDE